MEALLVNKCAYNKENLTEMVKATRKFATTVLLVCVVILILLSGVYAFYLYDLLMAGLTLFFAARNVDRRASCSGTAQGSPR